MTIPMAPRSGAPRNDAAPGEGSKTSQLLAWLGTPEGRLTCLAYFAVLAGVAYLLITLAALKGERDDRLWILAAVGGFWMLMFTATSVVVWFIYAASKSLVGERKVGARGFRDTALALALVIASIVSPRVAGASADFLGRTTRAFVFSTPQILAAEETKTPRDALDALQKAVVGGEDAADKTENAKPAAPARTPGDAVTKASMRGADANLVGSAPKAAAGDTGRAAPDGTTRRPSADAQADPPGDAKPGPDPDTDRAPATATDDDDASRKKPELEPRPAPTGGAWALFVAVTLLVLLLARFLGEARSAFMSHNLEPPSPHVHDRAQILLMSYPTWIASLIYASILVPAAYLAVGALLLMRHDSTDASMASVQQQMDNARAPIAAAQADVATDTDRIRRDVNTLTHIQRASAALATADPEWRTKAEDVLAMADVLIGWPAQVEPDFRSDVLEKLAIAKKQASKADFSDYREQTVADYAGTLGKVYKTRRVCIEKINQFGSRLADLTPLTSGPAEAGQSTALAAASSKVATAHGPAAASSNLATDHAPDTGASAPLGLPERAASDAVRILKEADSSCENDSAALSSKLSAYSDSSLPLYEPFAASPHSTVLIMGLLGFGLFGAAIRMMARPDKKDRLTVLAEKRHDLDLAEQAAETARRKLADLEADLQQSRSALAVARQALAGAVHAMTLLRDADPADAGVTHAQAVDAEKAAALKVDTIERHVAEARSDLEVREREVEVANEVFQKALIDASGVHTTPDPTKREADSPAERIYNVVYEDTPGHWVVGSAAARVLVQGMGAAFTVFLAGQAGVVLLAGNAEANPYGLMLLCFVGAVFADEIWSWAREMLSSMKRPAPAPTSGPGTSPPGA